jgi:hypothetical protein
VQDLEILYLDEELIMFVTTGRREIACVMLRRILPSLIVFASCAEKNQDPEGAATLWDEVHAADYPSWARAPGYEMRTPSTAPHGDMVDIYINDVLMEALASGEKLTAWPEGSLIVKDGFNGSSPKLVAIMEKRDDGWYFAEYEPDGEVLFSGMPDTCTGCHSAGADMVRAFGFP